MSIINAFLAAAGGGFEYESGSFTPTSNLDSKTVNFAKAHTKPPAITLLIDATASSAPNGSVNIPIWAFIDASQIIGTKFYAQSYSYFGAFIYFSNNSGNFGAGYNLMQYGPTDTSHQSTTTSTRYYAKESSATFYAFGSYRIALANRKMVWIAIWLPDSWVQPT